MFYIALIYLGLMFIVFYIALIILTLIHTVPTFFSVKGCVSCHTNELDSLFICYYLIQAIFQLQVLLSDIIDSSNHTC